MNHLLVIIDFIQSINLIFKSLNLGSDCLWIGKTLHLNIKLFKDLKCTHLLNRSVTIDEPQLLTWWLKQAKLWRSDQFLCYSSLKKQLHYHFYILHYLVGAKKNKKPANNPEVVSHTWEVTPQLTKWCSSSLSWRASTFSTMLRMFSGGLGKYSNQCWHQFTK